MKNYNQNNLKHSSSPYLKQHQENPINWQEWDQETLDYARSEKKLIFLSIGYATCHWCHVMASEAFSDKDTAKLLNHSFVSIKVDREQRPDIDQYFMEFSQKTTGGGGWPLNIILSPDAKPIFAATYLPLKPRSGLRDIKSVLTQIIEWYPENKNSIEDFEYSPRKIESGEINENYLIDNIIEGYDKEWAGFGFSTKFPPHSTLLFLMSYFEKNPSSEIKSIILKTLNVMARKGLHDHLQGGFYRYSVDRQWDIPHFEKMLYDQAMHLWTYSVAYCLFGKSIYRQVVEKLITCLEDTFEEDGLYYSALDADTNHQEGLTYVWDKKEIKKALSAAEFKEFDNLYSISGRGNFEGKNHLIKNKNISLDKIEQKLLQIRKEKTQPQVDKKIMTSWNSLLGISFIMAHRYTKLPKAKNRAIKIYDKILEKHFKDDLLFHSSFLGNIQKNEYLEDYAGFLLLSTFLYEDGIENKEIIIKLSNKIESFRNNGDWLGNKKSSDFVSIPAEKIDHPVPSAVSLAEYALFRKKMVLDEKEKFEDLNYELPLTSDFYNMIAWYMKGNYHEVHTKDKINYNLMPINGIQITSSQYQDCYNFRCNDFNNSKEMNNYFKELNGREENTSK